MHELWGRLLDDLVTISLATKNEAETTEIRFREITGVSAIVSLKRSIPGHRNSPIPGISGEIFTRGYQKKIHRSGYHRHKVYVSSTRDILGILGPLVNGWEKKTQAGFWMWIPSISLGFSEIEAAWGAGSGFLKLGGETIPRLLKLITDL